MWALNSHATLLCFKTYKSYNCHTYRYTTFAKKASTVLSQLGAHTAHTVHPHTVQLLECVLINHLVEQSNLHCNVSRHAYEAGHMLASLCEPITLWSGLRHSSPRICMKLDPHLFPSVNLSLSSLHCSIPRLAYV